MSKPSATRLVIDILAWQVMSVTQSLVDFNELFYFSFPVKIVANLVKVCGASHHLLLPYCYKHNCCLYSTRENFGHPIPKRKTGGV